MKNSKWFEELIKDKISTFVAFDNDLLMYRLYHQVNALYKGENLPKPYMYFYKNDPRNFRMTDFYYLDKLLTTIYRNEDTINGFQFPKTQIGYQGLYNALEFLLKQDPEFSDLILADKIYVPLEVMRTISEEMVYRLRTQYRKKLDISSII
jgi:hypothetical protein